MAGIDGFAPAGFTTPDQIPSPESQNRFQVSSSDATVIGANFTVGFDLKNGYTYVLFYAGLLRAGNASLSVTAPDFKVAPPLLVTVRAASLPLSIIGNHTRQGFPDANLLRGDVRLSAECFDYPYQFRS